MKPLCIDLFSGAGGAAMGLHRAGFEVIGVDVVPQPRYPFRFIQADCRRLPIDLRIADLIWASPKCQDSSPLKAVTGKTYEQQIPWVRPMLIDSGRPYVIENVPGAPLRHYITLCGEMFGLRTIRHRRFETSWLMFQPPHPPHTAKTSTKRRRADFDRGMHISITGDVGSWCGPACMGIDWMTGDELSQAIPPAYSEFIGRHFLASHPWPIPEASRTTATPPEFVTSDPHKTNIVRLTSFATNDGANRCEIKVKEFA